MFVRQLIGPQAGEIIDLPHHAAEACLAVGSAAPVTDEEIADAGLQSAPDFVPPKADELPPGYRLDLAEGGGYNVFDAGGVNLTAEQDIPNLAAARSFAIDHAQIGLVPVAVADEPNEPELPADWRDLHHATQVKLAKQFDETVSTKAEAIVVLEAAEKTAQA